jgi:hypothetical protein
MESKAKPVYYPASSHVEGHHEPAANSTLLAWIYPSNRYFIPKDNPASISTTQCPGLFFYFYFYFHIQGARIVLPPDSFCPRPV